MAKKQLTNREKDLQMIVDYYYKQDEKSKEALKQAIETFCDKYGKGPEDPVYLDTVETTINITDKQFEDMKKGESTMHKPFPDLDEMQRIWKETGSIIYKDPLPEKIDPDEIYHLVGIIEEYNPHLKQTEGELGYIQRSKLIQATIKAIDIRPKARGLFKTSESFAPDNTQP